MQPIHELLHRIRWDPGFAGEFEIAYVDHARSELERVAVRDLRFDPGDTFAVELIDRDGRAVPIPYHRIRKVYRDGALIWSREG
jgi:uncharacterized protein (UPF0248 family)